MHRSNSSSGGDDDDDAVETEKRHDTAVASLRGTKTQEEAGEARASERAPKWRQPKRLSGTEFPRGMEDHRYRKPSTGNLAGGLGKASTDPPISLTAP